MKAGLQFVTVIALALALVARADAGSVTSEIDFGVFAPTAGSISYAGGLTNPLVGTGITVDNVVGLNTPNNNHITRNCIGCTLMFTTGLNSGSGWTFGPGGSISIVGGVDLTNDGDVLDPGDVAGGTTLLSGAFTGSPTVLSFGGTFKIAGAAFVDVKDSELAAFYGLTGGTGSTYTGFFNIQFNAAGSPPGAFSSSSVGSGNIINAFGPGGGTAPLPSTALLIVSGLAAMVWSRRRTG